MSLALVSQAMSSQSLVSDSAGVDLETHFDQDEMEDRRSKFMRWGFVLLFGALVFIILMGVGGDEVQKLSAPLGHLMNSLAGLGTAVLLAGVGLIIYSGLLPSLQARQRGRQRAISAPAATISYPDGPLNTASMEREPFPAPSVAEHTTYTLDPPKPQSASRQS